MTSPMGIQPTRRRRVLHVENYGADGSVGYLMRRVVTVIRQGVDRRLPRQSG